MRRKNKNVKNYRVGVAVVLAIDFVAAVIMVATLFKLP